MNFYLKNLSKYSIDDYFKKYSIHIHNKNLLAKYLIDNYQNKYSIHLYNKSLNHVC